MRNHTYKMRALTCASVCALGLQANGQVPTPLPLPGLLRPIVSETRSMFDVSGAWHFRAEGYSGQGIEEQWYAAPLKDYILMPVPASYNEMTTNSSLRDFVGVVWYETSTFVPATWGAGSVANSIRLYFGSAHYTAQVWVNGQGPIMTHYGGHLPFEADVTGLALPGKPLRISVALNNTLNATTLPPGSLSTNSVGRTIQNVQMDFFNLAGIHRPVKLYARPANGYVDDVTTSTALGGNGQAALTVQAVVPGGSSLACDLQDADGDSVASGSVAVDSNGQANLTLTVSSPALWWPYLMSASPGYMHTLVLTADGGNDVYRLPIGLRTVQIGAGGKQLLVNGVPAYLRGFGKHEDAAIRGKGMDMPIILKDSYLLQWFGANSFRTSHYPYSDEIMDAAARFGIMVIDESPGVGLYTNNMNISDTLIHHLHVEQELLRRDKNSAAAIAWSVANEPETYTAIAATYFQQLIGYVKSLDNTRPVGFVCDQDWNNDVAIPYSDYIAINRYYGWYVQTGEMDTIAHDLTADVLAWRATYPDKPLFITEYGADTVPGLHDTMDQPFIFTEDYQAKFYNLHAAVFDAFRANASLGWVGEMTWCFADFLTGESINRVQGNKKGVLTRDREPKAAANILRARYNSIAAREPQCPLRLGDMASQGCTSLDGNVHVRPALPPTPTYALKIEAGAEVSRKSSQSAVPASELSRTLDLLTRQGHLSQLEAAALANKLQNDE